MKNIHLDISTIVLIILSLLGGNFKKVIIISIILFLHELGHLFYFLLFKVKINKITIYPFGSLIKTEKLINFSPIEELLISSAGLINQLFLFILFKFLYKKWLINTYTYQLFLNYNISILIFNALPIIPLDGYLILNSLLNLLLPFLKSRIISIFLSIISMIIFFIISFDKKINILFIIFFLIYETIKYIKTRKYIRTRFLLERILYKLPYHSIKYNNSYNPYLLKLNCYHYFNYIPEEKLIRDYFNIKK